MTDKLVLDERKVIECGFQDESSPPHNSVSGNYFIARATFHRKKPIGCLTDTNFTLLLNCSSNQTFESGRRYGTQSWVITGNEYTSSRNLKVAVNSDLALARARAKAAGSEFNFGETLVEFGETVSLLNSGMSRLYRGFSALRDGKIGKALSIMGDSSHSQKYLKSLPASKRLSKGYLELQFGWLPIISDIHSAVEAYGKGLLSAGDEVRKVSGSLQKNRVVDLSGPVELEARASVRGIVRSNAVIGANLNSLGLANPLLMAWNKLPFSFLLDWFVPIGTFLGGLTASAGLQCYSQSVTSVGGSEQYGKTSGTIYQRNVSGVRKPVVGLPSFSFGNGAALSLGQFFTGLALLRSLN